MSTEALQLLESKLSRLRMEHDGALLAAGASAQRTFDPMSKASYGPSIAEYMRLAAAALADYEEKVRHEVTSLTEQLLMPLTVDAKISLLTITERQFDKDLYPRRLALFIEGLGRAIGRTGQPASDWGNRTDLDAARHHAGTSSQVFRSLARLADDLELVRLRNAGTKEETKLEQANRLVKLEPNFFGLGINLNYLIRKLWGKRE